MQTKSYSIEFKNLTGGYVNKQIFSNLNASLQAGKINALLGQSGCGKSTLLKMILGLLPAEKGNIFINGQDILNMPHKDFRKIRRNFGVLFQDGALLGSLNLLDNIALPLTEHTKLSKALRKEAVMRTLDLVGLADFAEYYPSQLSGGMRKRAGLARALITEPPLLFCDEPTSGLDPITSAQMDQLLFDMKQYYPQMTIVLVTHDLASIELIAEHVLLLHKGSAIFNGNKKDFYEDTHEYTKQFIARKAEEIKRMASPINSEVRNAINAWMNT